MKQTNFPTIRGKKLSPVIFENRHFDARMDHSRDRRIVTALTGDRGPGGDTHQGQGLGVWGNTGDVFRFFDD